MGVYQVCSNKRPWFKNGLVPVAYVQVSDFMTLLYIFVAFFRLVFQLIFVRISNVMLLGLGGVPIM
jgi:hypothetical protein